MFFKNATTALPVTFKQELQRLSVKEGECGVFCCELSKSGAAVEWRKGRVILKPGEKYEMKQEGHLTKLIINNVEESDAGKYTCKTKHSQSSAELRVRGESEIFMASKNTPGRFLSMISNITFFCEIDLPCIQQNHLSADVKEVSLKIKTKNHTLTKEVENLEVKEGDSAAFCCELSKPGAPVDWRKGRVILKAGYKYEMKQERGLTKLIVNNVEENDAGKYTCKTEDSQSTAELTVKG
uniref:Ig-like domain-containing protein n=1 Tax=Poecilia mexicana TaxID=48701 RepID=A0A3B3YPX1_9TELE